MKVQLQCRVDCYASAFEISLLNSFLKSKVGLEINHFDLNDQTTAV